MANATKIVDASILKKVQLAPSRQELVQKGSFVDRAQCILDAGRGLAAPATTVWGSLPDGKDWKQGIGKEDLNNTDHGLALNTGKVPPYGPFVVGYGNPDSLYGAGINRDPRRAAYAARLLVRFEDVPLLFESVLGGKKSSEVENLNEWVDRNAHSHCAARPVIARRGGTELYFSFHAGGVYFGGRAVNLTRSKAGFASLSVSGDLVFVLDDGHFSGQEFIPDPAVRNSSPILGRLETLYSGAGSVYTGIFAELKKRLEGMQKLADGLSHALGVFGRPGATGASPINMPDVAGIITVDNT
ncbi:Uncharacterised protein [Candidatus Anstonella stagnisolia]|nr:Uncharacterised protein [Candidatus Anstonella stagnisolia]